MVVVVDYLRVSIGEIVIGTEWQNEILSEIGSEPERRPRTSAIIVIVEWWNDPQWLSFR